MDREWLSAELEAGRSIEAVARETGRDPSTVACHAEVEAGLATIAPQTVDVDT